MFCAQVPKYHTPTNFTGRFLHAPQLQGYIKKKRVTPSCANLVQIYARLDKQTPGGGGGGTNFCRITLAEGRKGKQIDNKM